MASFLFFTPFETLSLQDLSQVFYYYLRLPHVSKCSKAISGLDWIGMDWEGWTSERWASLLRCDGRKDFGHYGQYSSKWKDLDQLSMDLLIVIGIRIGEQRSSGCV